MSDQSALSPEQQDAIKAILGDDSSDTYVKVSLPSNGVAYDKEIEIRPFNFADEKAALRRNVKKSEFLNVLLERCVRGIDIYNLLIPDKLFLTYKLKEISTGSTMSMNITCQECEADNPLDVDLSVLNVRYLPEKTPFPFKFNLKILGKEVVVIPARVREEQVVSSFESLANNLWRFIDSINGIKEKKVLTEVIPRLPVEDVHSIMKYISMTDCGLDPAASFTCPGCGEVQEIEVPITANFFGTT
mgnify:CR=1 FL=1